MADGSGQPHTGAFDYATAVDERLCCPICRAPMQDPWMSKTCEHFYCYECILQHLAGCDNEAGTCPCDRLPLQLGQDQAPDKRQLVPAPRLVKLLCDELTVLCTSSPSCKWTGQRSHWQRHFEHECSRVPNDACPNACGYRGKALAEHQENDCLRKPIQCRACQESVPKCELENHTLQCPQAPVTCKECNQGELPRSKLESHVGDSCPEASVDCPHARYGCSWKGKRKLLRHTHLDVECIFEPLKGVLDVHEQRITALETENSDLKRDLRDLRLLYENLEQRVEQLSIGVGINSAQDALVQPVCQQLDTLASQVSDIGRTSAQAHRSSDQAMHEMKSEMNNMQMMLHDVRGELMALQHAQYYENAHRHWGRAGSGPNAQTSSTTASDRDRESSDSDGEAIAHSTPSYGRLSGPQPFSQPFSYGPGYPFPPYPPSHAGQPLLVGTTGHPHTVPPPGVLFTQRRWSGWPYTFGASSPEERGGGVKL